LDRDTIDAARGIGIVLVVLAHIVPSASPILVPYAFHMPLFFFLSGLTLPVSRPLKHSLARDFNALVVFYVLSVACLSVLSIFLERSGVQAGHTGPLDWRTYFVFPFTRNSHHIELFLVGWFLIALLFAKYLAVGILRLALRLPYPKFVAAFAATALGFIGMKYFALRFHDGGAWYWNLLGQVSVAAMYCILGALARQTLLVWPRHSLRTALVLYGLLICSGAPPMGMSWSQYPGNFRLHLVGTLFGIGSTMLLAYTYRGSSVLRSIGQHTKSIMTWHLASFALLNLWFVQTTTFRPEKVFDTYLVGQTWPVYVILGVMLPMGLASVWRKVSGGAQRLVDLAALFSASHLRR
jgi:fucose 4-O-acetylase-like acetyltransferase